MSGPPTATFQPTEPHRLLDLVLTEASCQDASAMAALINGAYRGESSRIGWTTEADLLSGVRTTVSQLEALIATPATRFLLAWAQTKLVGCICLEQISATTDAQTSHAVVSGQGETVQLGMIAVDPPRQNRGIGKWLIAQAEEWARAHWGVTHSQMAVIQLRTSLIAFYTRRGYHPTDEYRDFPVAPHLWQPKVGHLTLRILRKTLPRV